MFLLCLTGKVTTPWKSHNLSKKSKPFIKVTTFHKNCNYLGQCNEKGDNLMLQVFPMWETLETINHLLLHCKYIQQLWRIFLSLKSISWTMPRRVTEALYSWEEASVLAKDRIRWRIIPVSIWWAIWKERNSRCFEGKEKSVQEVKLNCILLLSFWCNQLYSKDTAFITQYRIR